MSAVKSQETYDGERPIDPTVTNPQSNKAKDKRRGWYSNGDQNRPDSQVTCSLMFEETFRDNSASKGGSRANKKCSDSPTEGHRGVLVAFCTANVAYKAPNQ